MAPPCSQPSYDKMILCAMEELTKESMDRPIRRCDIAAFISTAYCASDFPKTHNAMISRSLTRLTQRGLLRRYDGYLGYSLVCRTSPELNTSTADATVITSNSTRGGGLSEEEVKSPERVAKRRRKVKVWVKDDM